MCNSAAVVCLWTSALADQPYALSQHQRKSTDLDETWVELDSLCGVGNSVSVCFGLQIGLREA